MREAANLSQFLKENETYKTRAYEHALDLAFMFAAVMEDQGLTKTELAEKMNVPLPRLSKLFNTQPNMTLETIARFELALGIDIAFEMHRRYKNTEIVETIIRDLGFSAASDSVRALKLRRNNSSQSSEDGFSHISTGKHKNRERDLAA